MNEEVIRFGEGNLGFAMLSLPVDTARAPIVVAFNAGLTHREGPYRLNTLLCRALADEGYIAVRMDLAGKGDSPAREGFTNRESVALDWASIKKSLVNRFGPRAYVLMGLCSGADNAIKITADDKDVRGLILFDSMSPRDADFYRREMRLKLANIHRWINLPRALLTRIKRAAGFQSDPYQEMESLRDQPTDDDMKKCFTNIAQHKGKVLAVFTSQALTHYNVAGQFVRALGVSGLEDCCEEVFWPLVTHLYSVELHRDRLVKKVSSWGRQHFSDLC